MRWPSSLGVISGDMGLIPRGRAPLERGKTQNMCLCFEFFQLPILRFCLRLPKNNIPSGFSCETISVY